MEQIILIIDDEEKIRRVLSEIVEKLGLIPITACDGAEALQLLRHKKIDLIITDLVMPEMDGLKFIVEAKGLTPGIPIAVISGYGDVENATFALTRGAFNFITKPFTVDDVENIIRKGLRLRDLSLGNDRLLENVQNHTEITLPSYLHLIPSVALYIIKECQWRGVESENLLNNISVCADEMLTNALIHGNEKNPEKQITVKLHFDSERVAFTVRDEGNGFDVENFTHQFEDDQLDIPTKRGLFIVNYLMDKVSFNEKGNEITATMNLNKKAVKPPFLSSEN